MFVENRVLNGLYIKGLSRVNLIKSISLKIMKLRSRIPPKPATVLDSNSQVSLEYATSSISPLDPGILPSE